MRNRKEIKTGWIKEGREKEWGESEKNEEYIYI